MTAHRPPLTLHPVNDLVYAVKQVDGILVGNLKRIGAVWKFKAVGVEADDSLIPGGGPFTHRHNATFDSPDETVVCAALTSPP
jgi:hypothetical protein